ncbi:MAG: redoxin domain-containing protein [Bacteroidetes bacterium]|nr:redoxin domain-containing protein [Bacteroidota bacterium]
MQSTACSIRNDWHEIKDSVIVVIGVSGGRGKSHQKFAEKFNLPFPIVSDTDKKIMDLYGVRRGIKIFGKTGLDTIQITFIVDESSTIIHVIKFPDLKIMDKKS